MTGYDSEEAKAALRARMAQERRSLAIAERARLAAEAESRLFALPLLRGSLTVMLFDSFDAEIPTGSILNRLRREDHRVLLPFLNGSVMEAAEVRTHVKLHRTPYGPREPAHKAPVPPEEIDVVMVPGLAFGRDGYRVGYGRGHYDRFLVRLRPDAARVGLAYHFQLVERVPHGPGDQPIDAIVTDRQTVRTAGFASPGGTP